MLKIRSLIVFVVTLGLVVSLGVITFQQTPQVDAAGHVYKPTPTPHIVHHVTPTPAPPGIRTLPSVGSSLVDPPVSDVLSANWQILRVGEVHWYTFDHTGGERPMHIWMEVDPSEAAGFYVFDEINAEAIMIAGGDPREFNNVGAGTRNEYETGDLFWQGTFGSEGRYYVMVKRGWAGEVPYSIVAGGPGLAGAGPGMFAFEMMHDSGYDNNDNMDNGY
jgi:hypothetical protein